MKIKDKDINSDKINRLECNSHSQTIFQMFLNRTTYGAMFSTFEKN